MKTTNEYLDHVKNAHGIESDYALAKILSVSRHRISGLRRGTDHLNTTECLKIALLGDLDIREVVAAVAVERGDEETRKLWNDYVKKHLGQALACVAGLTISIAALLPENLALLQDQCILCQIKIMRSGLSSAFRKSNLAAVTRIP